MLVSQGGGKMISTTFHYGINVSNFDKCHHNIIYGKINIPVPVSLSPTYVREVLDYKKGKYWKYYESNI